MVNTSEKEPVLYFTGSLIGLFLVTLGNLVQYLIYQHVPAFQPILMMLCFTLLAVWSILKTQKTATKIKARKILFGLIILSIIIGASTDNMFITIFFGLSGIWPVSIFYSDESNALKENE